jgi:hypothetical protein
MRRQNNRRALQICSADEVAHHPGPVAHETQLEFLMPASAYGERTSGMKAAAHRRVDRARHTAFEDDAGPVSVRVRLWDRRHERAVTWVQGPDAHRGGDRLDDNAFERVAEAGSTRSRRVGTSTRPDRTDARSGF